MLNEFEQWETESSNLSVPKVVESKILNMANSFNKKQFYEKRNKKLKKLVKVAAIIILVITTVFTTVAFNVEAVRIRVFEFLFQQNEEYMNVTSVETSGNEAEIKKILPSNWGNIYYPDYLPKGYMFVEAEDAGIAKIVSFQNKKGDVILFSQQPNDSAGMIVDNEDTKKGEISINGNPAFWTSKNNDTTLIWNQNNYRFMAYGHVELKSLIQIAENLIFIK